MCLSWCAAPRSGLAWKNFIDTGAGVIDADYRGNVGVILFNHSDDDFHGAPRRPASPSHPPDPEIRARLSACESWGLRAEARRLRPGR